MQSLLCAAYHLRATDLFQQLVDAGQARVRPDGGLSSSQSLAALVELLHALHLHQQNSDGVVALPFLAEKVEKHAAAVFHFLPDVATDAALAVWEAARPLLEGAVGAQDAGADQAAKVNPQEKTWRIEVVSTFHRPDEAFAAYQCMSLSAKVPQQRLLTCQISTTCHHTAS